MCEDVVVYYLYERLFVLETGRNRYRRMILRPKAAKPQTVSATFCDFWVSFHEFHGADIITNSPRTLRRSLLLFEIIQSCTSYSRE